MPSTDATAHTFENWQATRTYADRLGDDAVGYEAEPGWHYAAGFILDARRNPVQGDTETFAYYVALPHVDCGFHSLADAEAFLWREWCQTEAAP